MTGIKPSDHGIVVEHKENGIHYAVSDRNYNEKVHRKVRDLKPGETVRGYQPKRPESLSDATGTQVAPSTQPQTPGSESDGSEPLADGAGQTEGAAPAASRK